MVGVTHWNRDALRRARRGAAHAAASSRCSCRTTRSSASASGAAAARRRARPRGDRHAAVRRRRPRSSSPPPPEALEPLRAVRHRDVAAGAAQVGALRRARRRRDPGDLEARSARARTRPPARRPGSGRKSATTSELASSPRVRLSAAREDRRRQGDQDRRVPRRADAGGRARARAARPRRRWSRPGAGVGQRVRRRRVRGGRRAHRVRRRGLGARPSSCSR